ncbi:MAG TPA: hypothetical protein VHV83_10455 [Armatimonadota bacterium]|nr:hypothetical protein [Armatimonadota bacterium]
MLKASTLVATLLVSAILLIGCGGGSSTLGGINGLPVTALQDPSNPAHPAVDSVVTLGNVVVTALDRNDTGDSYFWVEDTTGGAYSGICVSVSSDKKAEITDLTCGDVIDLVGTYTIATAGYDQVQFDHCTVRSHGSTLPAPVLVTTSDIAASNPEADRYEGVLIKVVSVQVAALVSGGFTVTNNILIGNFIYNYPATSQESLASITGIFVDTNNTYRLLPRDASDVVSEGADTEVHDATIAQIRNPNELTHTQLLAKKVRLSGILTAKALSGSGTMLWMQDPAGGAYTGIVAFANNSMNVSGLIPGDAVTLEGTYQEYYGLSEVVVDGYQKTSSGNPVPVPLIVQPDEIATGGSKAEEYESMLVQINTVVVTNFNLADNGEFQVANTLLIDNLIYPYDSSAYPLYSTLTSITGILTYSLNTNKLLPRSAADLVL